MNESEFIRLLADSHEVRMALIQLRGRVTARGEFGPDWDNVVAHTTNGIRLVAALERRDGNPIVLAERDGCRLLAGHNHLTHVDRDSIGYPVEWDNHEDQMGVVRWNDHVWTWCEVVDGILKVLDDAWGPE